jgi:hypothetical protein
MCGGRASLFNVEQKRQECKKGPKHFREPELALVRSRNPTALRKRYVSLTPSALEKNTPSLTELPSTQKYGERNKVDLLDPTAPDYN